jgi:hypothetical protein
MGRGAATFRKRDLRVALECAKPGDVVVLDLKAGKITIIPGGKSGKPNGVGATKIEVNEWDEVLDGTYDVAATELRSV